MVGRILVTGVLLAAGAMAPVGCAKTPPPDPPPPPEVIVGKPVAREITDYFEFPGQTAAVSEVEIRARVSGYLVKVNFEDGQEVEKGDLLFEIDPRPYEAALERAKGDLARLEALREKAEADLSRGERLRPSGAISGDEYEQNVAQLKVSQASIRSAEAAVRDAELNLEFTRVVSPINGRVSRARIKEGNLIHTGLGESTVLTTVVTTNPIYVYFNIDERALLQYVALAARSGQPLQPAALKDRKIPVEIALGNEEGFPHAGVLDFVDNKLDGKTGTIRTRGVFENAQQYLTPGLFVRVRVPYGKPHPALLVSERAIGTDQRQKYLLTVNQEKKVEKHFVTVGRLQQGWRVIESGIQPGDLIIVKGLQRVRPGVAVEARAEESVAASPSPTQVGKAGQASGGQATKN